jgi:hypothetical protein
MDEEEMRAIFEQIHRRRVNLFESELHEPADVAHLLVALLDAIRPRFEDQVHILENKAVAAAWAGMAKRVQSACESCTEFLAQTIEEED